MIDLDKLAVGTLPCPRHTCRASAGTPCVTVSGNVSHRPHSARTRPLYDGWRVGYQEGMRDAARWARELLDQSLDAEQLVARLERLSS